MNKLFVNGMASISAQPAEIFNDDEPISYSENILQALDQDYKALIKPMMLRRMSKAVKMSLYCSRKALMEAQVENPDAIMVGTGQGCMQDTEKFMEKMLESGEGLLSPTAFIQSTHNTVSGQIALDLNCKGHNLTFTQNSVSFESALIDAILQVQQDEMNNVLVGGVDETSKEFTGFQYLDGQIKQENIHNLDLLNSESTGTIISESAAFFSLGSQKLPESYAELKDVKIINSISTSQITSTIQDFLSSNGISANDVDAVILGRNGDIRFDDFYEELQKGIFSDICQTGYKHLVGDNNTISSYAFWLGAKILKEKKIPEIFKLNALTCTNPKYILIYNQYLGKNHGLILLQSI